MNKPTILFLSSLLAIAPCSAFAMAATTAATEASSTETSPTEGTVTSAFVDESTMQSDMLQMLANFATYLKSDFQNAVAPNSVGEACGCFKSNNTMKNNEDGVRSNADLSMVTAFLVKYGKGKVTLPSGVTWDELDTIARRSLIFAYSTHKANKLKVCAGNNYWGSTGTSDYTWESSLWAMSVAYSAFFQWDNLTTSQRNYVKNLLKAECNYELNRSIPTGYAGDTKAEENGWEADVLAATLGLFPDDELAPKWFERLREFAINSYSHSSDASDHTVIDPAYDTKTVADLYKGTNLYPDYTLQNHNYFHTSYQNVVIQELGEAALALKLFQNQLYGKEKWSTNALMHNNLKVQQQVLNWLALADGELAMPNGNDWSLFLYDQITSYSTNATFLKDPDALMLENLAYKMIKARQTTTTDGSWLLRSDIGARRMGVEAHRVMMSYLMHNANSTADLTPSSFEEFRSRYDSAHIFTSQNIVRAYTPYRFTTFSWAPGISSYTGYIAANSVDKNKIIVPFKSNNTGNFIGWYTVSGKNINATPVVSGVYQLDGTAWTMNGELNTNDATLNNRFAIYSTPGNAVIYLDQVKANTAATVTGARGGLMAISMDEFTKTKRNFYTEAGTSTLDGNTLTKFSTNWLNIDDALGVVAHNDGQMAFGERANNNSIMTAKLYADYSTTSKAYKAGDVVAARNFTYYSNVDAATTSKLSSALVNLKDSLPDGWNGVVASDADGSQYILVSNFNSSRQASLQHFALTKGAPVFTVPTTIEQSQSSATFAVEQNHSYSQAIKYYVEGTGITAQQQSDTLYLQAAAAQTVTLHTLSADKTIQLQAGKVTKAWLQDGELYTEDGTSMPQNATDTLTKGYTDITAKLENPNFEQDQTYSTVSHNVTSAGVTFASCYTNNVAAASSKWPNILPVKGWTAANGLSGGSKFCRNYSMPYSDVMYCVSPSSVGNYYDRVTPMVSDAAAGVRTLTVLNSWDKGNNAIRQTVTLPKGTYRVLMNVKYVCTNQVSNTGSTVVSSGCTNTSLTGVSVNGVNNYKYPTAPNEWQTLVFDFTTTADTPVTLSCGYATSASVGAANNTLMYIDDIRLLSKASTGITSIRTATAGNNRYYNLQGQQVSPQYRGVVINNGRCIVKNF